MPDRRKYTLSKTKRKQSMQPFRLHNSAKEQRAVVIPHSFCSRLWEYSIRKRIFGLINYIVYLFIIGRRIDVYHGKWCVAVKVYSLGCRGAALSSEEYWNGCVMFQPHYSTSPILCWLNSIRWFKSWVLKFSFLYYAVMPSTKQP